MSSVYLGKILVSEISAKKAKNNTSIYQVWVCIMCQIHLISFNLTNVWQIKNILSIFEIES